MVKVWPVAEVYMNWQWEWEVYAALHAKWQKEWRVDANRRKLKAFFEEKKNERKRKKGNEKNRMRHPYHRKRQSRKRCHDVGVRRGRMHRNIHLHQSF